MRRIFGLLLLLCLSTAANASVVWRGDFETGDLSQWTHVEGLAARFAVVPAPARQGKYAVRAELHQGDVASNGTRNELDYVVEAGEGTDLYYAWSTMFPAEYPNVTGSGMFQIFTQWHQAQAIGNAPPVVMNIVEDHMRLTNYITSAVLWEAPIDRGVWHDFIVHAKWSSNASVGFLELWVDGQKMVDHAYGPTLFPGTWVYLKQGLYRNAAIVPTAVLYHDGMTVATALEDVLPGASTPPAPGTSAPAPQGSTAPQPTSSFPGGANGGCASAASDVLALAGFAALALLRRRRSRA